ncbi:unnamed protein product, partial [Meganyctiphanes norvegica]
ASGLKAGLDRPVGGRPRTGTVLLKTGGHPGSDARFRNGFGAQTGFGASLGDGSIGNFGTSSGFDTGDVSHPQSGAGVRGGGDGHRTGASLGNGSNGNFGTSSGFDTRDVSHPQAGARFQGGDGQRTGAIGGIVAGGGGRARPSAGFSTVGGTFDKSGFIGDDGRHPSAGFAAKGPGFSVHSSSKNHGIAGDGTGYGLFPDAVTGEGQDASARNNGSGIFSNRTVWDYQQSCYTP